MEEEIENIEKSNKKFIIKFIIFLIILILITGIAIYFTIRYFDDTNEKSENVINTEIVENTKNKAEDSKYGIKSYTETYDINSIKITKYYDVDGEILTKEVYDYNNNQYCIQFIQIEGLKDKNIQNKINEKLKQMAYNMKNKYVFSTVTANFSNVLSVKISNGTGQINTLNIDLTTGEDIPFEKIFLSSAMVNSYLSEGLYENLAWKNLEIVDEDEVHNDMDEVDTSEYEDKFIMLINKYNKVKNDLKYNIYPSSVSVYDLIDKNILDIDDTYEEDKKININLIDHMEEVAIYKRYLTKESIFEDDSLGVKDIIVLTGEEIQIEDYVTSISYGKIEDNIFMEEILLKNLNDEDEIEICTNYIKQLSENRNKY